MASPDVEGLLSWAATADEEALASVTRRYALSARQETELRNAAIVAWRDAGGSLRVIAKAADLSHTAVAKIVRRRPC